MRILVVTGGIGSGKSLVCRKLMECYGIPVYEADRKVKMLYAESPSMLDDIEHALGVRLRDENGCFVPALLADIIFTDKDALSKVEQIIFPYLIEDFNQWAGETECEVVAFESATVLEKSQFEGFGDIVLLIDAPQSLRLSRVSQRDALDDSKVLERMSAQPLMNAISGGALCERVDHVIINDSGVAVLEEKIGQFIEKYGLTKML